MIGGSGGSLPPMAPHRVRIGGLRGLSPRSDPRHNVEDR